MQVVANYVAMAIIDCQNSLLRIILRSCWHPTILATSRDLVQYQQSVLKIEVVYGFAQSV
jgi:hypothetical protein